jgi:hypothetical protein
MSYLTSREAVLLAYVAPTCVKTVLLTIGVLTVLAWFGVIDVDPFWSQFLGK